MKRINVYPFLAAVGLAFCFGVAATSCKDDLASDEHYRAPDWLKGNAYEVLQKDGNHTIFLRAIDLSNYREIVAGKSIMTVVAPNDDAFRTFLAEKGYASIDDLFAKDPAYLNKLVGYHLMYYAFDWNKMVNFRPTDGDGATPEEKEVGAGYFYKHRTHSIDPIEQVRVKLTPYATTDTLINLYHYERYLPVLSNKLFETKGIDPVYNYSYFYPATEWTGKTLSGDCFNIANAKVLDKNGVVTDNGYLYHVDHVLEPLNTIYDELRHNAEYSKFLAIYDKYSVYELADDETNQSLGYQVYVHNHGSLPSIAREWPSSSWRDLDVLDCKGYNVFAPTNAAIADFFNNFWTSKGGYTSIDNLDPLILEYFVRQSFSEESFIVFPEEIKKGLVKTVYGTPITINPDDVPAKNRKLCANGTLYGMSKMDMPAIFSSVVGPAFADTTYRSYLYALHASSSMLSLASKGTSFVTLMPSNRQLLNTEPQIRLYSTTLGKELQQYSSDAGDFVAMSAGALKGITEMHVAQNVAELKASGVQVVPTNAAYNYWFVKDGRITTNALFNQLLEPAYKGDPFVALRPISNAGKSWANGHSYAYDAKAIFERCGGDGLGHRIGVCADKNYPYYMFAQLLQKAGLAGNYGLSATVTGGSRFILFAPTNAAIEANLAKIPGCAKLKVTAGTLSGTLSATEKSQLARYLCQYFVNALMNSFTNYPFIGSTCKGEFYTAGAAKMVITDTGSSLGVRFLNSTTGAAVTPDYNFLPFAFSDGCLHFIDGILL